MKKINQEQKNYAKSVKHGIDNVRKKSWIKKYNNITWTEETWNAVHGCHEVSPGCRNCYARELDQNMYRKFGQDGTPKIWCKEKDGETATGKNWGINWSVEKGRWVLNEAKWDVLFKWNAKAEKNNSIILVFVGDMNDLFEDHSITRRELKKLWQVVAETPNIHYQFLTKRPENIKACLPDDWAEWTDGYPNVWLGCSVENSDYVSRFNDHLAHIPATVRFISYEPALGPLKGINWEKCDWLIGGGESGNKHRAMELDWMRDVRDQVKEHNTTFFFKQSADRWAGRGTDLDGVIHYNFPTPKLTFRTAWATPNGRSASWTYSTTASLKNKSEKSEFIQNLINKHNLKITMKTNLNQNNTKNGNIGTLGTAANGSNKINMKDHITNVEGGVAALQSRKESLSEIFPLVEAVNSAKRKLEEAMANGNFDITDPETEASKIELEEVRIGHQINGIPPLDLTPTLFEFGRAISLKYPDGLPSQAPEKRKRRTELNPRQDKYLKEAFMQVLTNEYQSNKEIKEKVLAVLGDQILSTKASDSKFFNSELEDPEKRVVQEDGKPYSFKSEKTVGELLRNGLQDFTTMTFRMHKSGMIESESRRIKGENGTGNQPFYRLKQDDVVSSNQNF